MERVKGKERRNRNAAPDGAREGAEQENKQNAIARMKQQICQVITGRTEAVHLTIHHVRDPGQRAPICGIAICECPLDASPSKAASDVIVLGNVSQVVPV